MDTQPAPAPNGTPAAAAPEKKKTLFETVLTSTPVLLTVVATFMVGQSTGEMTRAQYHRAVAGQNQSKVGDQWSFFQAKRIRGTTYEVNADVFMATAEPLPLSRDLLVKSVSKLEEIVNADKPGEAAPIKQPDILAKNREKTLAAAKTLLGCLKNGFSAKKDVKLEEIENAFATMNEFVVVKLPKPLSSEKKQETPGPATDKPAAEKEKSDASTETEKDKTSDEFLKEAVDAINDRKPEEDIARLVIKIKDKTLKDAIAKADEKAKAEAARGKKAENILEQIDLLMDDLARASYAYMESRDSENLLVADVRDRIHKLMTSYKAARHLFTCRRYENDARSNQKSAELYEVNVQLSSAKSDRHMERSRNFIYAMLVAQVGVIIASLAMAVKQKSLVWMLATLAGLVAIGFGGYVFLGMN